MLTFLWGASALGCWVIGLFFLRFWRNTRDRLFAFFAAAFWVLGSTGSHSSSYGPPTNRGTSYTSCASSHFFS